MPGPGACQPRARLWSHVRAVPRDDERMMRRLLDWLLPAAALRLRGESAPNLTLDLIVILPSGETATATTAIHQSEPA